MKFGKFEALGKIGAGGMGTVWEVRHPEREERFAAKVATHPRATLPEFRQRFEREVRAMAKLRHPNVVRVFDYGVYEEGPGPEAPQRGTPWVVLEYAPGGELDPSAVDDWASLQTALVALLRGLAHSHARDLVHRDIKPENLLWVERRGRLVPAVADFGIAHALDRQRPSSVDHFTNRNAEEATGTPRYMAPEQFMGLWRDYGPPTDLYATGILAYVLASRKAPFTGQNLYQYAAKHMEEPFPELEPHFDVPDHFEPWVRWLTEKKPGDRPQTAREALDRLLQRERQWRGWREAEPDDEPGRAPVGLGLFGLQRTFLIGREAERERLWGALRQVAEASEPAAVALHGAPGVGKTRLADWLAELALEEDAVETVFRAHFSTDNPQTAGLAWMLAQHFRCVGMKAEPLSERLELLLDGWDEEARYAMGQVVAQAESVAPDITSPTVRQSMVMEMARRVVADAAARGPVIVCLEDVGDDPTGVGAAFLERLATDASLGPVLVVATSSSPVEHADSVEVEPLPPDVFRRFLRDELGLTPEISDTVERLADGNPEFALQLLEHWLERDELRSTPEGLILEADDTPTTIETLWDSRIAALSLRIDDAALPVLTAAGVLGNPVEPTEWLATAGELGVDIESPIFGEVASAMVDAGIGRWDSADRMRLVHRTVAPLLAEAGGAAARRKAHGAAARALSSLYSSNEQGLALRVARHFREAGKPQLAIFALEPAMETALDFVDSGEIGEVAEAMLATHDAVGLAEDAPKRALARAYRAIEWIKAGRVDDRERGGEWLDEAVEIARAAAASDPETSARIRGIHAWASISRGGREEAAATLETLVVDHSTTERTRLLNRVFLTHLYTYLHDDDAVRQHAYFVAKSAESLAWKLRAREALIYVELADRNPDGAKEHAFPALILSKQLKRLHLQVHIENLAGFIADLDGKFARAEDHHARAEKLAAIVQPQSGVRMMAREYRARAMVHQAKWREAFDLLWSLADELDAGRALGVHPWDALLAAAVALGESAAEERARPNVFDLPAPNALHVRSVGVALAQMRQSGRDDHADALEAEAREIFDAAPGVSEDDLKLLELTERR